MNQEIQYTKYIDDTLRNMKSHQFQFYKAKFSQDNWVICLDDFTSESEICITNEWSHIFHTEWLKSWYLNMRIDSRLTWPHCKCENTPHSKPLQSGEFPSMVSFHWDQLPLSMVRFRRPSISNRDSNDESNSNRI